MKRPEFPSIHTRAVIALCSIFFIVLLRIPRVLGAGYTSDIRALVQKAEPWPAEIAIQVNKTVTREKYCETAEFFFKAMQKNAAYYLAQPKPYPNMSHNLVRKMMERYLYQVFPMGAFPHHSDSCGWNVSWGHWVYIFENCATAYRDGRYKWAAHRIYDYGVNRIEDLGSWGYTGKEAGWSLLKAYTVADDSVAEKQREWHIVTTKRRRMIRRSEEDSKRTRQFFDLSPS